LVEIARALDQQARFVVMDEPSSSLDRRDTARLLDLIEDLRDSGIGVLYVSHRLEEVVRVADRAVVLRDGAVAGELRRGEIEADALVRLMIGGNGAGGRGDGDAVPRSPPISHASGAGRSFALGARELRLSRDSPAVSFDLRAGEILGLFGLVGAGRTELIETLFGLRRVAGGALAIADDSAAASGERPFAPRSAGEAIAAGLALVPEDRKSQGLVAEMSVGDNLTLAVLARRPLLAWRDRGAERRQAAALCESLDVRPPRPEIQALRLSGGNQQKVVLGKWLAATFGSVSTRAEVADDVGAAAGAPRILLLDEPTRGVDVGARAEIHRRLRQLASSGAAILLSSAESEEILALADRVLVLRGGAIAGMLEGAERTEHNLLRLAAGA
jgi:ribose transport system ATP-binding protein